MRYEREQLWWLGACFAGLGLTALAGGIIGPEIALFALVGLAGWLLIRYEGPAAVAGPPLPVETAEEAPVDSLPDDDIGELAEAADEAADELPATDDACGEPDLSEPADGVVERQTADSG